MLTGRKTYCYTALKSGILAMSSCYHQNCWCKNRQKICSRQMFWGIFWGT